jgi:hypothetical protein
LIKYARDLSRAEATIVADAEEAVTRLRAAPGKDIWLFRTGTESRPTFAAESRTVM